MQVVGSSRIWSPVERRGESGIAGSQGFFPTVGGFLVQVGAHMLWRINIVENGLNYANCCECKEISSTILLLKNE